LHELGLGVEFDLNSNFEMISKPIFSVYCYAYRDIHYGVVIGSYTAVHICKPFAILISNMAKIACLSMKQLSHELALEV